MNKEVLHNELRFKAIRSGGAGGQHVNKVSSKVVLSFDLNASQAFSAEEKERLYSVLASKLSKEGFLLLSCDESRSQFKNKALVIARFLQLIETALQVPKSRKATKIPKAVIEKRLKAKRSQSALKETRQKPKL
ncbi:alternative ribosome rescue aminoacyl-tRNA hydrolase ArfB [Flavobacterium suncheonense]|uniref:Peptide chain release factor 1 n=1 Tax=Flavobacterium suncheonense GH29-5 = DSM 17707 TaxID=1121899 RepID=A0A0A2MAU5_9FLAO|nr:alternative ribosome rescue aminoacyl-tRNA hydrolase ArfB [Flavobacterium suncheonense]KGO89782.1 peptide chain release factor 1 [Flavobacterium suncheonense GH29-5 = DSM 17707]